MEAADLMKFESKVMLVVFGLILDYNFLMGKGIFLRE
jgi:hypothetical protein